MNDNCMYCGGKLVEKRVNRVQEYQGKWFLVEDVPALVCEQCGEIYYTPSAHDLVLRLVRESRDPVRFEPMAVLSAT